MPDVIGFLGGLPDPAVRPDLRPLLNAVIAEEPEALSYGGPWGSESLRALVAERLASRAGTPLHAQNVVMTNGCAGALGLVSAALLAPDDVVLVEELTYPGALDIFRRRGATVIPVPLDQGGLDVAALERILDEPAAVGHVRMIYTIASCQSPTGTMLDRSRRVRLARLAEERDIVIIQDDTYGEILYDDLDAPPLVGLAPDRTLHLGSFSKTMAPGIRLGWAAGPAELAAAVAAARTDLGGSPVLQRAVFRFLESDFDEHLRSITSFYREKRDVLVAALEEHCSGAATWTVPQGGFFLWLRPRGADVDALADAGRAEGVGFLAGPYFSAGTPDRTGVRLAYGELAAPDLAEGARRLGRALERTAALIR